MIGNLKAAAIFLKHKASKFGKWAITKPTAKKVKTGDPMIKTDVYHLNKIIKDPSKHFYFCNNKNEVKLIVSLFCLYILYIFFIFSLLSSFDIIQKTFDP